MNAELVRETFRSLCIKFVALHFLTPHGWPVGGEELHRLDDYLRNVLGFEDSGFTLFGNPDLAGSDGRPRPGMAASFALTPSSGNA